MDRNTNIQKIIIIATLSITAVVLVILFLYASSAINKQENIIYQDEIKAYLNETYKNENQASKSPLLGMLNFNFKNIENMSTEELIYTNLMSSSEMNEIGINNIYQQEFNMTKSEYIKSPRYLSNPYTNCYYYQNTLKKSGFNCDSVCSKSDKEITNSIIKNLEWSNVLPKDIDNYCVKNAIYPIESKGYFVNLTNVKELFRGLTNKELTFESKVTNNKYYKYDSYLEEESLRLEDNIKEITNVTEVKISGDKYIAEYMAKTEKNKTLTGKVTLEKNENTYYIVSNEINTKNEIN